MKYSFTHSLMEGTSRPIIDNIYGGMALIDTGAEIPVCTLPVEILKKVFHAELKVENAPITGFGGRDYGSIYILEAFRWNQLVFPFIPIFVPNNKHNIQFRWIFSASMLDRLEYHINMKKHVLTIYVPDDESLERRLHIYDKNGKLHVLCEN